MLQVGRQPCGDMREEYVPGRGMNKCKDPEVGICLVCSASQGSQCGWSRGSEGRLVRNEVREVTGTDPVGLHELWGGFWCYPEMEPEEGWDGGRIGWLSGGGDT